MAPLEIKVTGSSTITRRAERCVLTLSVSSSGASQDIVSQEVKSTTNNIQDLFKQLAPTDEFGFLGGPAAITASSMTSLRTSSWIPDDNNNARKYKADVRFEVIFKDFAKLGEVMGTLFTMAHVEIDDIEWRLTDATKAKLGSESRKAAIRDAKAKASDYAEVLGREVVAVEIEDGWARYGGGGSNGSGPKFTTRMAHTASSANAGSGIALEPHDVELSASVQVKFVGE
ncbi:hypothetical protein MMC30_004714 [Trapelia coarctata]|nr:hypothetical protein [Trapelia coarctata]